jgi:2',3'-cyclic-nucleotide 2'-phosphodiesterase (5'-nucleotidase family)
LGGLSKRYRKINEISAGLKHPRLLVDSGNVLFSSAQLVNVESSETIVATGVYEIYAKMKYDAVAVGPFDLSAGLNFIQDSGKRGMPWVSSNLYDLSGNRIFSPFLSIKKGGRRIAVTGITGETGGISDDFLITDGVEELRKLIPELTANHDLIVVLSSMSHHETLALTRIFPQISIVIGADQRKGNITPFVSNNAVVTQTATQGKYLGVLSVIWADTPWKVDPTNKLAQLHKHLESTNRELNRLKAEKQQSSEHYIKKKALIENNRNIIVKEISVLEATRKAQLQSDPQSSFESHIIPLHPSIREDRKIDALVRSVKEKVNRYNTVHKSVRKKQ